jgi:hypothetical protein
MSFASIVLVSITLLSPVVRADVASPVPAPSLPATAPAAEKIRVQILGRVKTPGDLVLDDGARLSDALRVPGA